LCGHTVPLNPHPRYFSFNHHSGACAACSGLGSVVACDVDVLVNHPHLPLFGGPGGGAIQHRGAVFTFLTKKNGWYHTIAQRLAKARGFDLDLPFHKLPKGAQQELLWGAGDERFVATYRSRRSGSSRSWSAAVQWKGLAKQIQDWFRGGDQSDGKDRVAEVMRVQPCPECQGSRVGLAQRHVFVSGMSLPQFSALTVEEALARVDAFKLRKNEKEIAADALKEVRNRLRFLASVGLEYLTLDRSATTLSGGEAQRIRLATQLGNRLVGVLYVLDEPTIGLHPRDTEKLMATLLELRDLGNTVVAVEHDEHVIRRADWVLDMGPGAGRYGGKVVAMGAPDTVMRSGSLTARYLEGELGVPVPSTRRAPKQSLAFKKLAANNVAGVHFELPLGVFVAVTGVSGSGKSSLVMDALLPELHKLAEKSPHAAPLQVVVVDQSPIGTTPASVPASYVEVLAPIRDLFASTPQAKVKGFRAGRFSFNVAEGRCADCEGKGQVKVEMHFLADVWITCETCRGKRYDVETLSVRYRDRTIADVLAMEAKDALEFFGNHARIRAILQTMVDVGLGYLQLGQPATTLSGGEAQRLKLVPALARMQRGHTVFILDEPTTGLHLDDVSKLVATLQRLVERGDTVLVIEHHLDVIKSADVVIEMGPEAGERGGKIVAQGTPEEVAKGKCHTARFLREALAKKVAAAPAAMVAEWEG
jgi:excinuclease ABC subunit A